MKMPIEHIREEIRRQGQISFARFMDLALYCPETGYYESQKDIVGRAGDFITSVSTGSLFGELLAFQFMEWLQSPKMDTLAPKIVEAGAHDGKLAGDILSWLKTHQPSLFDRVEYCILEPSPQRQTWQKDRLQAFAPSVRWFNNFAALSAGGGVHGVIFSNELLDAFSVHRLGWSARDKRWFEWAVNLDGNQLTWVAIPPTIRLPDFQCPPALLDVLPDQYTIEISPAAENWWREAATALTRGKFLAIDYGFTDAEMFAPARTRGTLRAYHRHRVSDDLLANPGEQDLTAHVNFSAIQRAGESAGLRTETFSTQPRFLTRVLERLVKTVPSAWEVKKNRQFQTLTHPEHLGRAFSFLVQERNAS